MQFRDRVVVVTGGGSGIGAALCRRIRREGPAGLAVVDRDEAAAREVARETGGVPVVADLGTAEGVHSVIEQVGAHLGHIDVYCSNAGVMVGGGAETADRDWDRAWAVNVMAHVRAARLLLPGWLAGEHGCFVGTVSAAGLLNHPLAAPYAATKAAALSFLEWLSMTHSDDGIAVSAVCPEGVRTPMLDEHSAFLAETAMTAADVADVIVEGVRQQRFLILPQARVGAYAGRRGEDHDRWLAGMRRLRSRLWTDDRGAID